MASVNFKKLHSIVEVSAMLRHDDTEERLKHEHKNKDIDKELTSNNINLLGLSYRQTLDRYKYRLAEIDASSNTNRRKDRVTCFALEVPAPQCDSLESAEDFLNNAYLDMTTAYKKENIIGAYIHKDEVHGYIDHGEIKQSRYHLHVLVIPEIDGKLNGKLFSSKKQMSLINKSLDKIARECYGVPFLTGEKPQKRTVEELKTMSDKEIAKQEEKLKSMQQEIDAMTSQKIKIEEEITQLRTEKDKLISIEDAKRLGKKQVFGKYKGGKRYTEEEWLDIKKRLDRSHKLILREEEVERREREVEQKYSHALDLEEAVQRGWSEVEDKDKNLDKIIESKSKEKTTVIQREYQDVIEFLKCTVLDNGISVYELFVRYKDRQKSISR